MKSIRIRVKSKLSFPKLFVVFVISFAAFTAKAQDYYSIAAGDWNNTTFVWSTDGVSACGCTPPLPISGYKVEVRHFINMTDDILILGATDSLIVRPGGLLASAIKKLTVTDGVLLVEPGAGPSEVGDFSVEALGEAFIYEQWTSWTKWVIDGTCDLYALGSALVENIEVKSTGLLTLHKGAQLDIVTKDLIIEGQLHLDTVCVRVVSGNITNNGSGVVSGEGRTNVLVGDIQNDGIWSVNVDWCAGGTGTGLPIPEDCSVDCIDFLPIELLYFDANPVPSQDNSGLVYVLADWETVSEYENDYFTVESSQYGFNFDEIGTVNGAGTSSQNQTYDFLDKNPYQGVSYYRLKQTDFNGFSTYSDIKSVYINVFDIVNVYPIPAEENVSILVSSSEVMGVTVQVYNNLGQIVRDLQYNLDIGLNTIDLNVATLSSGVYSFKITTPAGIHLEQELLRR